MNTKDTSAGEIMARAFFEELKTLGFIVKIEEQPEPFILSDKVSIIKEIHLKTKIKTEEHTLLDSNIYTADFKIIWNGPNIFHHDLLLPIVKPPVFYSSNNISYIECKPIWDYNNMTRIFLQRTRPWVYQKFGVYVNLMKSPDFFKSTFIPAKCLSSFYYKVGVKKGLPKFKWEYSTSKDFIQSRSMSN
jgi:hypothetical protein